MVLRHLKCISAKKPNKCKRTIELWAGSNTTYAVEAALDL